MKKFMLDKPFNIQKFISEKLKTEWVIFISDMLVTLLSLYVTLRILLGKDIQTLPMFFILKHCLVFALISFALFSWIRSNQGTANYITLEKIPGILGCAILANLFYHPLMLLMGNLPPLTPVLNTGLFMTGLLLPRLLAPFWRREDIKINTVELFPKIPVVVVGYNEQIGAYLREHESSALNGNAFPYHIEGILLKNSFNADDIPPPFPVLGVVNDFVSIVQKLCLEGREPKRLLITQESLNYLPIRHILLKFQGRGILSLRFEISPASNEVTLRPLHIEDLLGKSSLELPEDPSLNLTAGAFWQDVQSLIDSARVLITGVHDLVIHQLAHHVVGLYPKQLIMVDPSENVLAGLKTKFDHLYPDVPCHYIIGSITDHETMDLLIETHHPQIIIHGDRVTCPDLIASNLKTVVQKNILSPLHFASQVQRAGASLFVLVNSQTPTLLSKIITTLVSQKIQALDEVSTKKHATRYLIINSCDIWNNLDSPTFFWPEQLNQGLSIEVPSPDAYSYIISAEEAARTILQAIVKALADKQTKGKIFYLTGGEPSRFLELLRSLSLLNGLIPEVDVKVNFSGKPQSVVSFEATDVVHTLTPGVTMRETQLSLQTQENDLVLKLADLVEKGQASKIVALLEKISLVVENEDAMLPLKKAG
ncbi:MAG: polysaccharide biosynthesis protein [Candidatus Paracaedibacter sp.]